tara:strand:- start:1222 stop:4128 length:2907 start_codon:yes stop_codon:yes gene_type:complete
MKKLIAPFATLLIISSVFAQAPEKMNYQAVARDLSGLPLVSTAVNLQFDILQGSASGALSYSETQSKVTNQFGLFTAEIGAGTTISGSFPGIAWGANAYFLKITVNGDEMAATQLLSVPYALYSKESANGPSGADGLNCWDTNGNGIQDAAEDINGDSSWDALDCQGSGGTFTAGSGIDITGNVITATSDTSLTNELQNLSWNTSDSNIIHLSNGNGIPLSSNIPLANQVLTWNGANWIAQNVGGGAFNSNGTETVLNTITDNVGIGTATPNAKLTVASTGTVVASFAGVNPVYSALAVSNTPVNPNAGVGMILLTGSDTGAIGLNPIDKQMVINNSTTDGHMTLSADSSVISYAQVLGQNGQKILEKADTIISFGKTTNNVININQGTFITDSLYVVGILGSAGDVLTNDGFGQAQWKPSGGGSLWNLSGSDVNYTAGNVGVGANALPVSKIYASIPSSNITTPTALQLSNSYSGALQKNGIISTLSADGTGTKYGLINNISQSTGVNDLYGVENTINHGGSGDIFGMRTIVIGTNTTGRQWGVENILQNTGTGTKEGTSNTVSSTSGVNPIYGTRNTLNYDGTGAAFGYTASLTGASSEKFGIWINGEDKNFFSNNVGIGTQTPGFLLDVVGTAEIDSLRINNSYAFPTAGGVLNEVLTADAAGNATWQTPGGADGNGIYTGSSSLSGNTVVTQVANTLTFNSTATNGFNIDNNVANNTAFNVENLTNGTPGIPAGSVGAKILVSAANTERTGVFAAVTGTGTGNQTAVVGNAEGAGSGFNRGISAVARNSTNTNIAGDFIASGNTGINYGLRVTLVGTQISNKYGLRVIASGNGTKYGFYSSGEDRNYFSGDVGIGTIAPTSKLHITGGHLRHEGLQPSGTGNGTIAGSSDVRGAVDVNFNPTGSIIVTFTEVFTLAPTVIITPVCNADPSTGARYWVNNVSTVGFTVNWANSNSTPSINYMVIE